MNFTKTFNTTVTHDHLIEQNSETYSRITDIHDKIEQIESRQQKTEDTLIDVQWRGMKENLIFTGISESHVAPGETKDCEAIIKTFLRPEMNIQRDIRFDRVHRLEFLTPVKVLRPTEAKFTFYKDKEFVRNLAPKTLIGKKFGVNEQFPKEIEDRRKLLYPEAKVARQNKDNKVRLVRDKLYINGQQYVPQSQDNTQIYGRSINWGRER